MHTSPLSQSVSKVQNRRAKQRQSEEPSEGHCRTSSSVEVRQILSPLQSSVEEHCSPVRAVPFETGAAVTEAVVTGTGVVSDELDVGFGEVKSKTAKQKLMLQYSPAAHCSFDVQGTFA